MTCPDRHCSSTAEAGREASVQHSRRCSPLPLAQLLGQFFSQVTVPLLKMKPISLGTASSSESASDTSRQLGNIVDFSSPNSLIWYTGPQSASWGRLGLCAFIPTPRETTGWDAVARALSSNPDRQDGCGSRSSAVSLPCPLLEGSPEQKGVRYICLDAGLWRCIIEENDRESRPFGIRSQIPTLI